MTPKANELRIGNYLNGKQGHVIITEIRENNIVKIQDNTSSFYVGTCLEPIQLTEEWLFKFGFLKDLENDIFLNINAYAFLYWQNNRVELLDDYNNFMISHCDYVHQLQNLYFALTGEELSLKNNSNN